MTKVGNMKNKNEYSISKGNLMVLQLIPEMLLNEEYRNKIRKLCMDYYIKFSHKTLGMIGGYRL